MADPEKPYTWPESNCNPTFNNEEKSSTRARKHDMALQLGTKDGSFAADKTPTPNRFLRFAEEVGLFQDLQNVNPFEETFKRASEARSGGNRHPAVKNQLPNGNDDTLHTPQIFPHLPDDSPNNPFICKPDNINLALERPGRVDRPEPSAVKGSPGAAGDVSSSILQDKEICDISDKEKTNLDGDKKSSAKSPKLKPIERHSIDHENAAVFEQIFANGSAGNRVARGTSASSEGGKILNASAVRAIETEQTEKTATVDDGEGFEILLKLPGGKEVRFKAARGADASHRTADNLRSNGRQVNLQEGANGAGVKRKLKDFVCANINRNVAPTTIDSRKKIAIRPLNSRPRAVAVVPTVAILGLTPNLVPEKAAPRPPEKPNGHNAANAANAVNAVNAVKAVDEETKKAELHERNKAAQLRYRTRRRMTFESTVKKNKKLEAENRLLAEKLALAMREIERLNSLLNRNSK